MKKFLFFLLSIALFASSFKIAKINKFYSVGKESSVSICADINTYFNEYNGNKLKPFISIIPKDEFSVSIDYKKICIDNLKPSTKYQVFISKNIPLSSNLRLDKDYTTEIKTTNYAPSFYFKESGYILPQKGDISIPIEATNCQKLAISLYRINSNNLIDAINQYGFVRALEYWDLKEIENEKGYKLWDKRVTLEPILNKKKTYAINVGKFLKKPQSGVYILAASKINKDGSIDRYSTKTQWFMLSDIGLFSLEDDTSLYIYTKHLSDASLYDSVKLELRAKNNEILANTITKDGKATFKKSLLQGKGGLKAKAVYAYGKNGDFSVLDLSHMPFNLSDRGVDGREPPKYYDTFIYSNRGIFKPGESIKFNCIIKNLNGTSANNLKVSANLKNSSYKTIAKELLVTDNFGFANAEFKIPKSAKRGRYKIVLYATNKEPIGILSFLVEDFIPPKIEVKVINRPKVIIPNKPNVITAKANYLTKEPLPNAEAEIQRVIFKSKTPFKKYKEYHFGEVDEEFENIYLDPINATSDEDGNIEIEFTPKITYPTSSPLLMHFDLSVSEPGGRAITNSFNIFYANKSSYIGIKPNFKDDYIDLNAKPSFNLIYLKNQKPSNAKLYYKLIQEEEDYNWINENGSWEYDVEYSDIRVVKNGEISLDKESADLTLDKLDWGSYKIVVSDKNSTKSSYRFFVGYFGSAGKKSPDRLPLSINKSKFQDKEKLIVNIKPKFSGPIMINIANYHIFKTKNIDAKEGENTQVEFIINKNWGHSVYVLATAFRAQSKTMGATRAIGVAHFSIEDKSKLIKLNLDYPNKIESKSPLSVGIRTNNKEEIYLTLSAVDKGILNLTKYRLPSPIKHFFGQLKLGISIRDIYGDLIKAQGEHAKFDSGAGDLFDSSELEDKEVSNKRVVVALMSKKIKLNNGKATVKFNIPNYQGALKLHAIAWSKNALGEASGEVVVKDRVSCELYTPLFLIKEDKARLTLRCSFDKEAQKGIYKFNLKSDAIELEPKEVEFNYQDKNSFIKAINSKAIKSKESQIIVEALKDNSKINSAEFNITIKDVLPKVFVRDFNILKSGDFIEPKKLIDISNLSSFYGAIFKISNNALIPADALKQELDNYSYRCAEQTTSRAFPLLNSKEPYDIQEVNSAIEQLTSMQHLSGGFGLWSNSKDNLWISSYVLDFLTRAKNNGFKVPSNAINTGLKFLENSINRWEESAQKQEANIYALYVLARNNHILMSDIMHFVNDTQSKIQSGLAWGQLGATLKLVGEESLAKELFNRAKASLNSNYNYINYGGKLRDEAALVVLLSEAGYKDDAKRLLIDLSLNLKKQKYLSTQELSQILRANSAISPKFKELKLKINNQTQTLNKPFIDKTKDINKLPKVTNLSSGDVWYSLSYIATPKELNTTNNGFEITKSIYTLDGKSIDLTNLEQSKRYVVLVSGKVTNSSIKNPILSDFLPSGLEIENPIFSGIDTISSLSWLKKLTPATHKEYRDDRFVATFKPKQEFKFAYILRAVTIGKFTMPPAKIEDMYKPRYRAFSNPATTKIIIKKRGTTSINKQDNNTTATNNTLSDADYLRAAKEPLFDLSRFNAYDLNSLRNAIFAYIGLDFSSSNPALHQKFLKFSWYKPTIKSGAVAYSKLNAIQKENVQKLLKQEKKLLGNLTLADFYRVNARELDKNFLNRYTKEQLRVLRNSLIARYGLVFKDKKLDSIFRQFKWYKPNPKISSSEIIDNKMNALQRANLLTILQVEKSKK